MNLLARFALILLIAVMVPVTHSLAGPRCQTCRYDVRVTSVYDGDTFSVNWPGLPNELNPLSIRLRGVDTPERNSSCARERELASAARAFTVNQLNRSVGYVRIGDITWDKYGGRVDADVYVGPDQQSLAQLIIAAGHGRVYTTGRRAAWC